MKNFFNSLQLFVSALILFLTFALMLGIVMRYNRRWDFTQEKAFTISSTTQKLIESVRKDELKAIAFYPQNDPARKELEIFFKQIAPHHPGFKYEFYDPDRAPRLAREYHVDEMYTLILQYQGRQERIVQAGEGLFANALLRLSSPQAIGICFVTGHGEASVYHEDKSGYSRFREVLEYNNYSVNEIILSRDKVPESCTVLAVAGPHRDMSSEDYDELLKAFSSGKGILFLVDPMDPGSGSSFRDFFFKTGIFLGSDVIVDKMGRMMGGDFLVPLVSQYVSAHPITKDFKLPSFLPVARSVQPSTEAVAGLEVVPLAFTGSSSWAESNLIALEKGQADFDAEADLSGPLSVAVAAEMVSKKELPRGRTVVVGDSDFLSNAYLDLAGNRKLALNMILWLSQDQRSVVIEERSANYKPLFVNEGQRMTVFMAAVIVLPMFFLAVGLISLIYRQKTS